MQSEWARNVIAAGHCRIHLHDQVFELDEPVMADAGEATDLPWPPRRLMGVLGFKYLNLRTFAAHPATLALLENKSFEADQSGGPEIRLGSRHGAIGSLTFEAPGSATAAPTSIIDGEIVETHDRTPIRPSEIVDVGLDTGVWLLSDGAPSGTRMSTWHAIPARRCYANAFGVTCARSRDRSRGA